MDLQLPHSSATENKSHHKEVSPGESTVLGLSFAWELGYTIALPAIVFCLGGAKLDNYLGTSHIFFFIVLLFALSISFIGAYKKISFIIRRMPKDLPRKPRKASGSIDPEVAKEQEALHALFRPPSE